MKPEKCHILEQRVASRLHEAGVNRVIIGVSGGADSVALLMALQHCEVETIAVHCNFHLRADESERDQTFVENLCNSLQIPLITIPFATEKYAAEHKLSIEMACRELRYAEFRRLKEQYNADRIAVAHNADDNAETLLLNLMRGAGISGLRGMLPDTGEIIRPLLTTFRSEILDYLDAIGVSYVTDSSNLSSDYRRNFIRNEILPLLETRWPQARKSICRSAANLAADERVIRSVEGQYLGENQHILSYSEIESCPYPDWLISRFVVACGGSYSQAGEITKCLNSDNTRSGKQWVTNAGIISAERDCLQFIPNEDYGCDPNEICMKSEEFDLNPELMSQIRNASNLELWTDLNPTEILFRHPRVGDRIKPIGMSGSTLVSKILKDNKLSLLQKQRAIIAEKISTGEILWIEGLKRSRLHLVTSATRKVWSYKRSR